MTRLMIALALAMPLWSSAAFPQDRPAFVFTAIPDQDETRLVERFTRVDADNLQYEATVEDPNVFVKPWKMNRVFTLRPELERVDEFVCENNRDYRPLFGK